MGYSGLGFGSVVGVFQAFVVLDGFVLLPLMSFAFVLPVVLGLFWIITYHYGWQPAFTGELPSLWAQNSFHLGGKRCPVRGDFLSRSIVGDEAGLLGLWQKPDIHRTDGAGPSCPCCCAGARRLFPFLQPNRLPMGTGRRAATLLGIEVVGKAFCRSLLGNFKLGQEYFIDGTHFPGLLTRFFPFITLRPCGQSSEVEGSVELRLLHEGSSRTGVRIIGKVERFAERSIQALPQVNVRITDSAGSFITTTDAHGTYEELIYRRTIWIVEIVSPNLEKPHCEENDVKVGQAWGCTLTVFGIRSSFHHLHSFFRRQFRRLFDRCVLRMKNLCEWETSSGCRR